MKTKLAVFDIDGTIIRSSLILELVNGFIERKIFTDKFKQKTQQDYDAWINRRGNYVKFIKKIVNVYQDNIKGKKEKQVRIAIKEIIESEKDKVYVFTRDLIKELKKENYFILAISGSPEHIVEEFSKSMGFDAFFGSKHEVVNGVFTGKQLLDVSKSKLQVLLEFIKANQHFDLKDVIGVGDSEIDISFLEMVGNPIAFNPDDKLAKYAKKKKWRIVIERKNVIYELKDFSLKPTS